MPVIREEDSIIYEPELSVLTPDVSAIINSPDIFGVHDVSTPKQLRDLASWLKTLAVIELIPSAAGIGLSVHGIMNSLAVEGPVEAKIPSLLTSGLLMLLGGLGFMHGLLQVGKAETTQELIREINEIPFDSKKASVHVDSLTFVLNVGGHKFVGV